ncbi:hypothetical protein PLEOSDRAFT_154320 [Pleurotus ostreatus PC15]|uniref:Oxidoreductase-like domain-containing protein n=1 Tax=Pleurotus ostreatus (strain PC15) TaxID=1137138 RepID=A0A067NYQ1_PLEO1|nr:hypothetical protein PLEOSDRAFT_154320 [Pleurotus ostreatus PC15]
MSLCVTYLLHRTPACERLSLNGHRRLRWNSTGHLAKPSLDEATERIKRPTRGGQNLSLRYARLERSLRGKESFQKELDELAWASEVQTHPSASANTTGKDGSLMFRGFFVPEKPRPPEADECCMSGCAVCVYDLYEDSLSAYKESLATLRSSLEERGIPETEWPSPLRGAGTPVPPKNNVALSAFEEFERALKAKKQTSDGQVVPRWFVPFSSALSN